MTAKLVRAWQTETGDGYVASLVRCIFGALLLVSSLRDGLELVREPYFADVFHFPVVPEAWVPSRFVYAVLIGIRALLATLVLLGWSARPALALGALTGIALLLCDRLHYHNNRYALFLFSFLLAFAPCDRAFVFGAPALSEKEREGPLFAQRLAQLQLSLIYLASGGSKLLDPDWRGGLVLGDRLRRSVEMAAAKGVPPELMQVLGRHDVAEALSKLAIGTELFLAFGLFVPEVRFFALWWGVMFHVTIEATSNVELFGWLSLTVYALFAVPTLGERRLVFDPNRKVAALLAACVRRLDWLRRFEVVADGSLESNAEGPLRAFDRDGAEARGLSALAVVTRGIPVLFPLAVPLWVAARVLRLRTRAPAAAKLIK